MTGTARDCCARCGVVAMGPVLASLAQLRDSAYLRRLDADGPAPAHDPAAEDAAADRRAGVGAVALNRVLHVLERIGGRTVYLALLNENVLALSRLVDLCAQSGFLAEQIAAPSLCCSMSCSTNG